MHVDLKKKTFKNALHITDKTHMRPISQDGLTLISRCPVYRIDRQNQYVQRLLFKIKAHSVLSEMHGRVYQLTLSFYHPFPQRTRCPLFDTNPVSL